MRLRYAPTALVEPDELLAYLSQGSPQRARLLGIAIQNAERTLTDYPYIGQITSARPPIVRRYLLRTFPYVLFYEASETDIMIIGVRHTARDPSSMPGQP